MTDLASLSQVAGRADTRTLLQKLAETWPAKMAQAIYGGLTLPGDVYVGRVDPGGLEAIGRAAELTGVLGSGAPATAVRGAAGIFGGRVGYHGSPQRGLSEVVPNPPARQYDNATSQLGAFFAPTEQGAMHYAGKSGTIYKGKLADESIAPYEMPWSEFARFQAPNKGADGTSLPPEMWAKRAEELKAEAAALREQLRAEGYGGVIVRKPRTGEIFEMSSFSGVPVEMLEQTVRQP